MSDATSKAIRAIALHLAANNEPTCCFELPDGTVIIIEAARTLLPGEKFPPPVAALPLPPVKAGYLAPHPSPIYFDKPVKQGGRLNTQAPRYDSATPELRPQHLIFPRS